MNMRAANAGGPYCTNRRQTAILLGSLLAAEFAVAALMPLGVDEWDLFPEPLWLALLGAVIAQPALLAIWATFGPQRAAVRLPLVCWLAAAGCLSVSLAVNQNAGEITFEALLVGGVWLAAFAVLQPPLWLVKAVRRWRLTRPASDAAIAMPHLDAGFAAAAKSTSQFSLRAMFGWILAVALLLGGFRALAADVVLDQDEWFFSPEAGVFAALLVAAAALPAVALAWIMLADGRRRVLRVVLTALVLAGLAAACYLSSSVFELFDADVLLPFEAGVMLNAAVCFGAVRACGFRLRRPAKRNGPTAEHIAAAPLAAAPVSRLRFAFALAPLVVAAIGLAAANYGRLEQWRRAEIRVAWRRAGWEASFATNGTIDQLKFNPNYSNHAPLSDESRERLASLENLRELVLAGSSFDDGQLAKLAPPASLESLDLTGTAVTDDGLQLLVQFPRLAKLDLANTSITDAGLTHLSHLPRLRELTLTLTDVSDEGLRALEAAPALESVDALLTAVTAAGAERFRRSRPQANVEFGASDDLLTSSPKMSRESVIFQSVLGVGTVAQSIELRRLHARGRVVADGISAAVTDAGLKAITAHPEIEELDLRESEVTDTGLMTLRTLANLKRLDLRGSPVTEQGVASLARVLPDCEILR